MTGEIIDINSISSAIIYIADKLNMTLAQIYEIYARAQFTIGIVQIVMVLAWCGIMVGVFIYTTKNFKKELGSKTIFDPDVLIPTIFVMVTAGAVFGLILTALYSPVIAVTCPEYSALQSLMHDIGQMVK
jgi:hypothetical protein